MISGKEIGINAAALKRAIEPHAKSEKQARQLACDLAELHSELDVVKRMIDDAIGSNRIERSDLLSLSSLTGDHWHYHIKSLRKTLRKAKLLFP